VQITLFAKKNKKKKSQAVIGMTEQSQIVIDVKNLNDDGSDVLHAKVGQSDQRLERDLRRICG
jgi:hypothetical protein